MLDQKSIYPPQDLSLAIAGEGQQKNIRIRAVQSNHSFQTSY